MTTDRRYWDSACFLAVLKKEPRWEQCRGVIQAAEAGALVIVTSAWTLTEVIHLNGGRQMAADEDDRISAFFERDYIILRPVTEQIGHRSRRLVWDMDYSTKDAIHVATAEDSKCANLDTFDGPLRDKGAPLGSGMTIGEPDLPYAASLFED